MVYLPCLFCQLQKHFWRIWKLGVILKDEPLEILEMLSMYPLDVPQDKKKTTLEQVSAPGF